MTINNQTNQLQVQKGGYVGQILRVDLTSGKLFEEPLPDTSILRKYLGCWGLALHYLYEMVPPGIDALDSENPLIFMTAPLTGVALTGATNITLATKNFNTGFTVGRSHTHGWFGTILKQAGYDGIIITGKSDKPVYLWIHNRQFELRDAGHLWGKKDSVETEDILLEEMGGSPDTNNASVACLGPAGENLVAGAMICNDKNHSFSHSGVGAVMGSKKLKAIAVFGDQPIPIADPEKFAAVRKEWFEKFKIPTHHGWNILAKSEMKKGDYRHRAATSGFCGKNFLENNLSEFGIGLSQQEWIRRPCHKCAIGCTYDVKVQTGPFKGEYSTAGPGGEPYEAAGAVMRILDPGSYIHIADLYDRLGIECSMAGCSIAMVIEAYEKGILTKEDTDGLELKWGDVNVAETLLRKMVTREGFIGQTLALGIKKAAAKIGGETPNFAVNIKGAAMNLHDWRSKWGILFSQITGSGASWAAGGADNYVEPDAGYPELTDRFGWRGKPMETKMTGIIKFMNDCTGMCMSTSWGTDEIRRMNADSVNAVTGWDMTRDEMGALGLRVMHLERAFNIRHGLKPEDDWIITPRLIDPPLNGPAMGKSMKPNLEGMVNEYNRLMGWDEKTGKPWRSSLKASGLDDVIEDMWGK
jgi:aldehyde:ferredoxin oxidoreductase